MRPYCATHFAVGEIGRGHQLEDGLEDIPELGVVLVFHDGDLAGEGFDRKRHAAQVHEGADDGHAHLDGLRTVQHRGGHDGAMFSEGVGHIFAVLAAR